jgi:ketopantoate reductase
MRIAIIGAGSVGGTLGQAWLKHGEDVVWGLRNAADPERWKFNNEIPDGQDSQVLGRCRLRRDKIGSH